MHTSRSLSSCILGGIAAALLAAGVSGSPFGFVSAEAIADSGFSRAVTASNVGRSRASDWSLVTGADAVTNTTALLTNPPSISRDAGAPEHNVRSAKGAPALPGTEEIDRGKRAPRLAPAPPLGCALLASRVFDPILSRFSGRCVA
jgi:hypothetical protein